MLFGARLGERARRLAPRVFPRCTATTTSGRRPDGISTHQASSSSLLHQHGPASPSLPPRRSLLRCSSSSSFSIFHDSSHQQIRPPAYTGIRPPDRTKFQGNWCHSPDLYEPYKPFLQNPIPEHLASKLPDLEAFVVETWLPTFPYGARLRRLQRDIAFRMLPVHQRGKLDYETELVPLVGYLQRRGILKIASGRSGRMILYHPDAEITYYKHRKDDDDDDEPKKQEEEEEKQRRQQRRRQPEERRV